MENTRIDPFEGVHKADKLRDQIRACVAGNVNADSYLRGALQWLEKHPPNKYIVPLLRKARSRNR